MRTLGFGGPPLTVLALGAHADDLEIGCGGTLMRLADEGRLARVVWVVFSADGERADEARSGARAIVSGGSGASDGMTGVPLEIAIHAFRDGYFPSQAAALKDEFERLKVRETPDLVLAPLLDDRHQDHRLVAELAWNTFRDHVIVEYELPKYEGDLAPRNLFVPLPDGYAERKVEALTASFPSQRKRDWFDARTFLGLMRLRGVECRSPSGYAEAFQARKLVL
jgi:LmbE family N-acetylglucosaminyl deacetylase